MPSLFSWAPMVDQRIVAGQKATIKKLRRQIAELQSRATKRKDGFTERPSLPPIVLGAGLNATPVCAEHGAMQAYKHHIWRCEECKSSVDLSQLLAWVRIKFDGVLVIQ